ncbi:META domain-containing protein [Erwinia endophytica]|uniref:META domain-containing protein n=1 Tax=Erwinia endophytica TaxID=1563158 RepID=UPI001265FD5E|nr:META domain-containing protein [Erwinia endophytica]KAB8307433.1 META domain-containing protein [Erwinia endophytica]
MNKHAALILVALLLAGCSSGGENASHNSLSDHNFVLKGVDGQAVTPSVGIRPGINFAQDMRVSGVMCNRFFGQGKLQHGKLSVPQLSSTRMLCIDPQLNEWETMIGKMLTTGVTLKLERQTLTLSGSGHTLVYVADH